MAEITKGVNSTGMSALSAQLAEVSKSVTHGIAAQMAEISKGVSLTGTSGIAAQMAEITKGVNSTGMSALSAQLAEVSKSVTHGFAAQMAEISKGVSLTGTSGIAAQMAEITKGVNSTGMSALSAQLAEVSKSVTHGFAAQMNMGDTNLPEFAAIAGQIETMAESLASDIDFDWDGLLENVIGLTDLEGLEVHNSDGGAALSEEEIAEARTATAVVIVYLLVLLRAGQVQSGITVLRMLLDLLAYEINRSLTVQGILYLSGILSIGTVVWNATGKRQK
jgi:hypothetical protein